MSDTPQMSEESIRAAVSESVGGGEDIRSRVRDLTLAAIRSRKLDPRELQAVMKATTEGIALGAERHGASMRGAVADAVKGLDEALTKSAEAGHLALQELTSKTRDFSNNELKQALASLKKIEEDFLATLSQAADAAKPLVKDEMQALLSHLRTAGTDTGARVSATTREFAQRMASSYAEASAAGMDAARELSTRWMQVASGILAGLADALAEKSKKG